MQVTVFPKRLNISIKRYNCYVQIYQTMVSLEEKLFSAVFTEVQHFGIFFVISLHFQVSLNFNLTFKNYVGP